jgi:LmbE family N-acetylglucosaminyl deacetylase
MHLHLESAQVFVPDGLAVEPALARTTHLAIAAHQDDLEIMAFDGIRQCFQRAERWFCGVVVTDGSGSARDAQYKDYSDAAMRAVRRAELIKAAVVGEYGALVLLDHPSEAVKDGRNPAPAEDLRRLLAVARPEMVYTHALADRHDTHVAVALRAIAALRSLPAGKRPVRILGCEVWGSLDWLVGADRVALDVSGQENLQNALLGVFDSQITGGKRYDLATMGRRRANATYFASHDVDVASGLSFAMDLTPLIQQPELDVAAFAQGLVARFGQDVAERIERVG